MNFNKTAFVIGFLLVLGGCGGSSSGGGSRSSVEPAPEAEPQPLTISGFVVDGPVSGGTLLVFSADNILSALADADAAEDRLASLNSANAIASMNLGASEDGFYSLELSEDQANVAVFLVFDGTGAEDLTFHDVPFNMESVSVLGDAGSASRINITPHTSMIAMQVRTALPLDASGVNSEIDAANANVIAAVGADEIGSELFEEGTNVITLEDEEVLVAAATSLGSFIRSTSAASGLDREEVLEAIALDALDGEIDGNIPASAGADQEVADRAETVDEFQSLGETDGGSMSVGSCSGTATLIRRACEIDTMDDYFEGIALCQDGPADELDECAAEAGGERIDTLEECDEIFEAREQFCALVEDEVHEPEFGEAYADNFIDPLEIGQSIEPNPYWPLVQGNQWVYESTFIDDGEEVTETVTVMVKAETKRIQGIDCVVVNDVVEEDGEIIEDTDDWFAQDVEGNIWYCGEIAQNFEYFEGDEPELPELIDLEGSWKAGREGAKAGIIVPAEPEIGDAFRTEVLYGDAEDVVEILSVTGDESTDLADCDGSCLVFKEFTPLEPDSEENSYYKPGLGVILKVDIATGAREELVSFTNTPVATQLSAAKLLIEHNATDEDTGFQGFVDGDAWNEFTITDPEDNIIVTVLALGGLMDFGLAELFFETSEPENAEVSIDEVTARLQEGTYHFATELAEEEDEATLSTDFSHDIPAGVELVTPSEDEEGVDPSNTVISWELVEVDIDDEEIEIVGYQVIVEQITDPFDVDGFAKPVMSVYLSEEATSLTVPAEFMNDDACYEFEVLSIEESGNQTIASAEFETGDGCEDSEEVDAEGLNTAKILIEHNATDEDTGFQGFADGDPWNQLIITDPDNVDVVSAVAGAGLFDFGLTEFFFETNEPENAEVSIEEVLARMPEGTYTFTGDIVDGDESVITATLTHNIPMGPVLMTPEDGAEDVDPDNTVVSWQPVTTDLEGDPITIVGYQVIVEIDEEPEFAAGFAQSEFSVYVSAGVTSVTIPAEFMESGEEYEYEVLAIEDSGNQTLTSAEFETQ